MTDSRRWRPLLAVAATATLTVVAAEAGLRRLTPPFHQREVSDAVADYRGNDPTVLVLGSSHARTFTTLGERLAARTGGRERLLAVPLEWGKLTSYEWVLQRRLRPLLEETLPTGPRRRPSLRRFVLVTEWWDSCAPERGQLAANLPSRAWELGDFLDDVARHGLTEYNRNYLNTRWGLLWRRSAMVQDRGHGRIVRDVKQALRPDPHAEAAGRQELIGEWRDMLQDGAHCVGEPGQMQALDRMVGYLKAQGLEVTVALYPRMPATLTPRARETTLGDFSRMVEERAAGGGYRFVDMTYSPVVRDDHFASDLDHMTDAGHLAFSEWALDNDLRYLLDPATPQGAVPQQR